MSRRCAQCRKWLASGQYTCDGCGAGEGGARLGGAARVRLEEAARSLGGLGGHSYDRHRQTALAEAARREEEKFSLFLQEEDQARYLANNTDAVCRCVVANFEASLKRLVPLLARDLNAIRDPLSSLTPVSLAIVLGRVRCLDVLVKCKSFDKEAVDPKTGKRASELALAIRDIEEHRSIGHVCSQAGFGDASESLVTFMWGWNPSMDKDRVPTIHRMLRVLGVAQGDRSELVGMEGISIRAEKNAVSQEVDTPPPFPRHVWVHIVGLMGVRERTVILPLVCRFFFLLEKRGDRNDEICSHFGLEPLVGSSNTMRPWLAWELCSLPDASKARRLALLKQEALIHRFQSILPLLRGRLTSSPQTYYDSQALIKCETAQGLVLEYETKVGKQALHEFKLVVANAEQRQTFRLRCYRERLGSLEGGSEGMRRVEEALKTSAAILGLSQTPSPEEWVSLVALVLDTGERKTNAWGDRNTTSNDLENFFRNFLLGSTSDLRIKTKRALELSGSMDVQEGDFRGISIITGLRWNSARLAEFFAQNKLAECVPVIEAEKLNGRSFLEARGNYSAFLPPDVAKHPQQAHELLDRIAAVKRKYFGE